MEPSFLEELGLTPGEARIYLALLELGESKVGKVIEKTGMASSAVHNALNTIAEKGLVTHILRGKIKNYRAVPPKQLLDYIDDKRRRVKQQLPALQSLHAAADQKTEAEVYEGTKGLITMLHDLISEMTKKDTYRFFALEQAGRNEEIQRFFRRYDVLRAERCKAVKGIAPRKIKRVFEKRPHLTMRYTEEALPNNMIICRDKMAFINWDDKPSGVLIRSAQLAAKYTRFFDAMWTRRSSRARRSSRS